MKSSSNDQDLVLVVGDGSLISQYLAPESGSYLGTCHVGAIVFKAPPRLTGVTEVYRIPNPFPPHQNKSHAVVSFDQNGKYVVEDGPSFNVALPYENFASRVAPGFYFGTTTGASVTFSVPTGRRTTTPIHTTIPGGDYVKGVDLPTLVQVLAPMEPHRVT